MSLLIDAARIAVAVNVVLLAVLAGIWGRNYRKLGSRHTLGMLMFAALLPLENASGLYFSLVDPPCLRGSARRSLTWRAVSLFHVLEPVAIAIITWTTLD